MSGVRSNRVAVAGGIGLFALVALGVVDGGIGPLLTRVFDAISHLFFEKPVLAAVRRPSQLRLAGLLLAATVSWAAVGLVLTPWLSVHARRLWAVLVLGFTIRAVIWVAGGNLPLVPGDSCHYLEVATSIARGEGPVKHYVESYFIDYRPHIRPGGGILDDWATPLYSRIVAAAFLATGVGADASLEAKVGVAKLVSFTLNFLCLPVLYVAARRQFGRGVALGATALLAILPVHAIYAGFVLRESLVALTSLLAVWLLTEVWSHKGVASWLWAVGAGVMGGMAILSRTTSMALVAGCGVYGLVAHGRRHWGPLAAWGLAIGVVIGPWGWETYKEYGRPFFSYTDFFQYNFSWTVHHYEQGNTRADQFYTAANLPEIARVKLKSLAIMAVYSTMILGLPVMWGFFWRVWRSGEEGCDYSRVVVVIAMTFVAGTLARTADVTQVAQLGRYFLPVFVLILPVAAAGLGDWLGDVSTFGRRPAVLVLSLVALLWADPTWAYDSTWLVKDYQLHWPALRSAGDWIREHPEEVARDSRVMAWFPWEFRVASDRVTILMPRSYFAPHIKRSMEQYRPTHLLWGSFEPPPHQDPERWGRYLEDLKRAVGLSKDTLLFRSPEGLPYPVELHRLRESPP